MTASRRSEPFLRYSTWLRERYGGTTYRVAVDAGFTCPVREAGLPCAYCDSGGSRAPYLGDRASMEDQIRRGIAFQRERYGAERLLLYFQAYSNTHAPVPTLRETWDFGLAHADFAGLVIATRPDCIDGPRAALLAEYRERGLDVWVELGLQSAHDETLRRVRRGHTVRRFDEAVRLLDAHRINVAAHLILGLPGEGEEEAIETARHVSALPVGGVKFHNLVVVEGTALWDEYVAARSVRSAGERRWEPPDARRHVELLVAAMEHLRPDIVVMRLTCDPPRDARHVPSELPDKTSAYQQLVASFQDRGTYQGIYWSQHADKGR